jgi:hypothetical protein
LPANVQLVRSFKLDRCGYLTRNRREAGMAVDRGRRGGVLGGISLGGILVIVGIIVAFVWSLILGVVIAVIGLVAFGGFVRGKWY